MSVSPALETGSVTHTRSGVCFAAIWRWIVATAAARRASAAVSASAAPSMSKSIVVAW